MDTHYNNRNQKIRQTTKQTKLKLGSGELRQNTTDFTKFITLTTCFGRSGPSSAHKSTRKTICSVQTYVLVHGLE